MVRRPKRRGSIHISETMASMQNILRRAIYALPLALFAAPAHADEAKLILPDMGSVNFLGISGSTLLLFGLVVCVLGLAFGMSIFAQLRKMEVHRSMLEVSELIY